MLAFLSLCLAKSISKFDVLAKGLSKKQIERAKDAQLFSNRFFIINSRSSALSQVVKSFPLYIDPAAKITDKHGNVVKVESLKFGSYSTDKYGFLPCPKCEESGNFGKKHFKFLHAEYRQSIEDHGSDPRGNYATTNDEAGNPNRGRGKSAKMNYFI